MITQPQNGQDNDLTTLTGQIEQELFDHIVENLKAKKITLGEGQVLAQEFLAHLPAYNKEQLLNILNTLGKKYQAAQEVYLQHAKPYEDSQKQLHLERLSSLIQSGDLTQALSEVEKRKEENA